MGIAPLHPIAQAMKSAGNQVTRRYSAPGQKNLLIMQDHMKRASDEVIVVTDDGSAGDPGFVTAALEKLISSRKKIDMVVAIGPAIMMKMVCKVCKTARHQDGGFP